MTASKLTHELVRTASLAVSAINDEVRGSIKALKVIGVEALKQGEEIATKAGEYIAKGLSGEMAPEIAAECARRETEALELLALTAVEKSAQEAARRAKRAIDIAVDVGIKLAQAAATAAAAGI